MVYHIFNKTFEEFKIFKDEYDFKRFLYTIQYYSYERSPKISLKTKLRDKESNNPLINKNSKKLINIISYVIMNNHFHMIVDDFDKNYISKYLNDILDSYTRYFNTKYKRKGPLWKRNKKVIIKDDKYLIHLTRYIHLNPTTSYLVSKPEEWKYSSYNEYIKDIEDICNYKKYFSLFSPKLYKEFVEDRIDYQRKLKEIENLLVE